MKRKSREGVRYGKLIVKDQFYKDQRTYANVICDCGVEKEVRAEGLDRGRIISCGCHGKNINRTHSLSYAPEYKVFSSIEQRCNNELSTAFKDYGAKGIKVEWNSFEDFYKDMGERPSPKHTIERVKVDGNYSKENCIWTDDRSLQNYNQNKKKTNTSGRTGVSWQKNVSKWLVEIGVEGKAIRLGFYEDFELACLVRAEAELKYYGFTKE